MKKYFYILLLVGLCFTVNAQSCKISGSNDGSTIVCTGHSIDGNNITVTLSNDSENTCANVSIIVKVTYANNSTEEFEGRGKSCPDQEAAIRVPIKTEKNGREWTKYEVARVSGSKCN